MFHKFYKCLQYDKIHNIYKNNLQYNSWFENYVPNINNNFNKYSYFKVNTIFDNSVEGESGDGVIAPHIGNLQVL